MSLYLKWTRTGRVPSYQGGAPIPYRKWTERVDSPVLCEQGWHACRWQDAIYHISDQLWVVELDGVIIEGVDKVAAERLRIVRKVSGINERTVRLFAADCAESVLHIYERDQPNDDRPRKAIEAARAYANGEIDLDALAAAGAAAGDAAGDAAWAAAWAATRAAARVAARAAARAATRAATRAAARDAARAAAGDAQTTDLLVNYGQLDPADFTHRQVTS